MWKNMSRYARRISVAEVVRAGAGAARLLAGLAVRAARRQAAQNNTISDSIQIIRPTY